jgi:hypothetical protein
MLACLGKIDFRSICAGITQWEIMPLKLQKNNLNPSRKKIFLYQRQKSRATVKVPSTPSALSLYSEWITNISPGISVLVAPLISSNEMSQLLGQPLCHHGIEADVEVSRSPCGSVIALFAAWGVNFASTSRTCTWVFTRHSGERVAAGYQR